MSKIKPTQEKPKQEHVFQGLDSAVTAAKHTPSKLHEFSKSVLVPNGTRVADAVRDLVNELIQSATMNEDVAIEYSLEINIESSNNTQFTERFGSGFIARVESRYILFNFEKEPA